MENLVQYTVWLLNRQIPKSQIKRELGAKFQIQFRQAENLICLAKARSLEDSGLSPKEHQINSLAFYESIITGDDTTIHEKLLAQGRIDWLCNLKIYRRKDQNEPPPQQVFFLRTIPLAQRNVSPGTRTTFGSKGVKTKEMGVCNS